MVCIEDELNSFTRCLAQGRDSTKGENINKTPLKSPFLRS